MTRFLEDGRLELDTNPVENAIRPVCLTKKCALDLLLRANLTRRRREWLQQCTSVHGPCGRTTSVSRS
ncbi:transposase [Bradyrhizobium yuanmingense]|nr:transposase [Bradyrhizobium yuanmingense]MDF0522280.1 transposase [Bradyrhizobium yuanmingense]